MALHPSLSSLGVGDDLRFGCMLPDPVEEVLSPDPCLDLFWFPDIFGVILPVVVIGAFGLSLGSREVWVILAPFLSMIGLPQSRQPKHTLLLSLSRSLSISVTQGTKKSLPTVVVSVPPLAEVATVLPQPQRVLPIALARVWLTLRLPITAPTKGPPCEPSLRLESAGFGVVPL